MESTLYNSKKNNMKKIYTKNWIYICYDMILNKLRIIQYFTLIFSMLFL